MKVDLHTHSIGHRYYYDGTVPDKLTNRDQDDIRRLLGWAVDRQLSAISVTDHDLALTGLWAREHAAAVSLPLTVLAGCECELYVRGEYIHLLAIHLNRPLSYSPFTPPEALVEQIHLQGGLAVLAHPMYYRPGVYQALRDCVDGIEYRNGAAESRGHEAFTLPMEDGYSGLLLHNSDYHCPDKISIPQLQACSHMDADLFRALFP
mgnify:FL=1